MDLPSALPVIAGSGKDEYPLSFRRHLIKLYAIQLGLTTAFTRLVLSGQEYLENGRR